jgi:4-hydroxythreonine-4-phosphate dehydrogenase
MILVTQGHQESIGLEVFLKSFICLNQVEQKEFVFYCNRETLEKNLNNFGYKYNITDNSIEFINSRLKCEFNQKVITESTDSINSALKGISPEDVLITLPTSKEQLLINGEITKGYTEFFRKYYEDKNITMLFKGNDSQISLLTDHIPLVEVSGKINHELIIEKTKNSINGLSKIGVNIKRIVFSGINPHAGENGLLGTEDSVISEALEELKTLFPDKKILGPISGDIVSHYESKDTLIIFAFHDQGLSYFKHSNKFIGANITFGLPFIRMSVDHGTAFDLYGKNVADYNGCLNLMKFALTI